MAECLVEASDRIKNENLEGLIGPPEDMALLTESNNLMEIVGTAEVDVSDCCSEFRHENPLGYPEAKVTKLPKFHECLGTIESCPQLKSILPDGYDYVVCNLLPLDTYDGEDRFTTVFRVALGTAEEAEQWLYEFQSSSKTTWRVDKTYPDPQTKLAFKKDYHCQHNTRSTSHKDRNIHSSHKKNTNCPAKLTITVKKFAKRTKSEDPHAKSHATMVSLKQTHNHKVLIGEALRHRPVSDSVRAKFVELFRSGLTPPQALARHQTELRDQFGDGYNEAVVDRFLCPDIHWCYRLYYKFYKTRNGISDVREDSDSLEGRANDVEAALRQWTEGLCHKLRQKPKIFVPVVEKLLGVSQTLLDNSDLSRLTVDCLTDDEKHDANASVTRPDIVGLLPNLTTGHRTVQNLRIHRTDSLPRKRGRPAKLTHTKEHDYSSLQPTENNDLGTDPKPFSQLIPISTPYGSNVILSSDMNLNALPESWGIMFGPQCDLQAQVTQFETPNQSEHEGVVIVTPQDLNDSVKETLMDVSMQYDVDHSSTQTYHFISEDNAHINIVHVNANQNNDVGNVADLKELLRCF